MDTNINPLELFKEEMESDDIAYKVNNIHKIPIIISLMTPDAIKNTLLPYLEGTAPNTQASSRRKTTRWSSPSLRSTLTLAPLSAASIPQSCHSWNPCAPMMRLWCGTGPSNPSASSSRNTMTTRSIISSSPLYKCPHADYPPCFQ